MAVKQTETFSMRMDKETYDMLQEIKEYKQIDGDSQAVRWLIRRYHKKKIAPDGDVKASNITIQGGGFFHICKVCQHMAERTDPVTGEKIMYCCLCAHDVDEQCNSATCGRFEEKVE